MSQGISFYTLDEFAEFLGGALIGDNIEYTHYNKRAPFQFDSVDHALEFAKPILSLSERTYDIMDILISDGFDFSWVWERYENGDIFPESFDTMELLARAVCDDMYDGDKTYDMLRGALNWDYLACELRHDYIIVEHPETVRGGGLSVTLTMYTAVLNI